MVLKTIELSDSHSHQLASQVHALHSVDVSLPEESFHHSLWHDNTLES